MNPAIKEQLFQQEEQRNGPWVPMNFLRALMPITASFVLSLAALEQAPLPPSAEHYQFDTVRLSSTNAASAAILVQVRQPTLEWNRLALATFASTNPVRSYSSNGSFFTNNLER